MFECKRICSGDAEKHEIVTIGISVHFIKINDKSYIGWDFIHAMDTAYRGGTQPYKS